MDLLQTIANACREHGMAISKFGRLAVGDPRFVIDLRNGRAPRPSTLEQVKTFLANMERPKPRVPRSRGERHRHLERGTAGLAGEMAAHRRAMRTGSARLLAAIRLARGEA
ncbi:MAG TPA: hypothetical protein VJM34_06965 [Novosphingobium sp.]|nr:hypothetical protein [Novosphingobium sp.]